MVALIIAIAPFVSHLFPSGNVGGAQSPTDVDSTNYSKVFVQNGILIGTNGNGLAQVQASTTASILGNASVTASTTKAFDIAVANAQSGDLCFAQGASTTQSYLGMYISGCSASTTSGFITLLVTNPGASAVVPYGIASSTHYLVVRPN